MSRDKCRFVKLTKLILFHYDIVMGFDKIELGNNNSKSDSGLRIPVSKNSGRDWGQKGTVVHSRLSKEKGQSDWKNTNFNMGKRSKKNKFGIPKKVRVAFLIVLVLFGLISIPAYATYRSGIKTYHQARLTAEAIKTQNIELASVEIEKTKKELGATRRNFAFLLPLKIVPVVNWYYNDAEHMMAAGAHGLDSATIVVDSLKPYADVLGLKGQGSFAEGSAEDRIKTAVLTAGKITPQIDKISESLDKVKEEMDKVDPQHYPKLIFGEKIQTQIAMVKNLTDEGVTFVSDAKPLIKVLPSLLGEKEEKKYLILFQNDKELRPTGGFLTGYAIFRLDKGVIHIDKSEDIYNLDDSIPNKGKASAPILKYLPKVPQANLRDSNLSPDFITSMEEFNKLYEKATTSVDVDGIVAIDTNVLVSTIKILDDTVTAGGVEFNTKEDARCDCPQVIYELEDNISRPVNYVKTDRKGLLGDLLQAIMTKALSSSPKIYWGPLFQSMLTQINEKHLLVYLYDEQAQKGIEGLNAAGRIKDFEGDYLHINESSFSGAKVNIFMEEAVEQKYQIEDGVITKTVTVNYKNPFPPSDCNLESGGLCLNAEYRDWFRIYVPKGSKLINSKGSQVKVSTYEEFGKTVFEGFLTVRPKGAAEFEITYTLPFKLEKGSPLPVLIQKQPGTYDNQYTIVVNDEVIDEFPLLSDKELELEI